MFLQSLPLVFVLAGLALYTVLAGADFGAGFWQLIAPRGERGEQIREQAHHSVGPVWEANHVWLIFVLTVFWTAYPQAFGAIFTVLALPLFIAAIGIVFRGAAYALRAGTASRRESATIDTIFSVSSILTPFALGAVIGAIAANRVPANPTTFHLFSSWWTATSLFIGVLAVTSCAYLAAVYLAADAASAGHAELAHAFRARALIAGVAAGAVAIAALIVLNGDNHRLVHSLLTGSALAAVIVSAVAGVSTMALVYGRRFQTARYTAAVAVAAIIAGWAIARWPMILPGLTISEAAAGHDALVWVVVVVIAGGAILFPSLAILFRLALTGRFNEAAGAEEVAEPAPAGMRDFRPRLLVRVAAASLIVGFGLLTLADAPWEHAVGVVSLFAFMITGFGAIVSVALADQPAG